VFEGSKSGVQLLPCDGSDVEAYTIGVPLQGLIAQPSPANVKRVAPQVLPLLRQMLCGRQGTIGFTLAMVCRGEGSSVQHNSNVAAKPKYGSKRQQMAQRANIPPILRGALSHKSSENLRESKRFYKTCAAASLLPDSRRRGPLRSVASVPPSATTAVISRSDWWRHALWTATWSAGFPCVYEVLQTHLIDFLRAGGGTGLRWNRVLRPPLGSRGPLESCFEESNRGSYPG
jgi:hypothetical protein